jgi:hypothetical protein
MLFSLAVGVIPASSQAPADTTQATPPAEAKPALVFYEKAKLVVDGEAEANGSISIQFVPEGGVKAAQFSVEVLKDSDKEDIAKAIHTQLTIAAGENYKVKVSDEEIKVERAKKEIPKFSLTVGEVKLPGVSVVVKKD